MNIEAKLPSAGKTDVTEKIEKSRVRKEILWTLVANGPKTTTDVAHMKNIHVSHASRAMAELTELGLLESMKSSSREVYYRATVRGLEFYRLYLSKRLT